MLEFWLFLALASSPPQEVDPVTRAETHYNSGRFFMREGKYDDAIYRLRQAMEVASPGTQNGAFDLHLRNIKANAQWELSRCLFIRGMYEEALLSCRLGREEYPRKAFCGNAIAGFKVSYGHLEAKCLEHLGRHDEAVKIYFGLVYAADLHFLSGDLTAHFRLTDLYEWTGQLDDLQALIDRHDKEFREKHVKQTKESRTEETELHLIPGSILRRILEIRSWAGKGRVEDLVALGVGEKAGAGVPLPGRYESWEACRALARLPDKAVLLLKEELGKGSKAQVLWVFHALALCGTPESREAIREGLRKEPYSRQIMDILDVLDRAGPAGRAIVEEIERTAPPILKDRIARIKEYQKLLAPPEQLDFPPLPKGIRLPGTQ